MQKTIVKCYMTHDTSHFTNCNKACNKNIKSAQTQHNSMKLKILATSKKLCKQNDLDMLLHVTCWCILAKFV